MQPIRFIHAADLHLDAAFLGLSREAPKKLTDRLRNATFTALQRLLELCVRERPDFLVLSGDIYNQEDRSLPAQLALHDACVRLHELAIPVFIVHGNHDPLSSCLKTLRWPDNVTIFGEHVEAFPVFRRAPQTQDAAPDTRSATDRSVRIGSSTTGTTGVTGAPIAPIALVYGVSHATNRESRNLAARFTRTQGGTEPCLHVGVLHAMPGSSASDAERYAPFSQEDLVASGMDYWALGHIHDRREICRKPLTLYSGCTQGLHINEPGEKGCLLVTAQPEEDGGFTLTAAFRPLGPVVWLTLDVPLDDENDAPHDDKSAASEHADDIPSEAQEDTSPVADPDDGLSLDTLESRLRSTLETASESLWPGCQAVIVRLRLTGRTGLDSLLRRNATCTELVDRLRDMPPGDPLSEPFVWVKDLDVRTRPRLDRASLLEREDLLGEILRMAEATREDTDSLLELRDAALGKLFGDSRARKTLEPLTETEMARLLDDAESLCMDLLEND